MNAIKLINQHVVETLNCNITRRRNTFLGLGIILSRIIF